MTSRCEIHGMVDSHTHGMAHPPGDGLSSGPRGLDVATTTAKGGTPMTTRQVCMWEVGWTWWRTHASPPNLSDESFKGHSLSGHMYTSVAQSPHTIPPPNTSCCIMHPLQFVMVLLSVLLGTSLEWVSGLRTIGKQSWKSSSRQGTQPHICTCASTVLGSGWPCCHKQKLSSLTACPVTCPSSTISGF